VQTAYVSNGSVSSPTPRRGCRSTRRAASKREASVRLGDQHRRKGAPHCDSCAGSTTAGSRSLSDVARRINSLDYRSGCAFAGQRVLVVGLGNTGAEIAADLVEQGAGRVAVAVRTTPPIVRREILGVPVQLFGIALSPFPALAES
jgi:Flavin-binding monooxygenase-like